MTPYKLIVLLCWSHQSPSVKSTMMGSSHMLTSSCPDVLQSMASPALEFSGRGDFPLGAGPFPVDSGSSSHHFLRRLAGLFQNLAHLLTQAANGGCCLFAYLPQLLESHSHEAACHTPRPCHWHHQSANR